MKRSSLLFIALTLTLAFLAASSAFAVFPDYKPGLHPTLGDGTITLPLQQGWSNNIVTWFISTDTNNIRWAETYNLTLAPKLSSALDNGARKVYYVTNFNNAGPVFATSPIQASPTYSGLWEVFFVTWNDVNEAHAIKNTRAETRNNPFGLPGEDKVTITSIPFVGFDDGTVRIVVDSPIVAMGSLGSPSGNPQFGGVYRIPQVIALNNNGVPKTITLPTFNIQVQEHITKTLGIARVIIPDVQDAALAATLKANVAPALRLVPFEDTQRFWVINWKQLAANGGILVVPPAQLPIVEEAPSNFFWGIYPEPSPFSWQNTNFAYSPIGRYTLLDRLFRPVQFPGFTDKVQIKTPEFIEISLGNRLLRVVTQSTRINAPQLPLPSDDLIPELDN